jgi:hypothetical protein
MRLKFNKDALDFRRRDSDSEVVDQDSGNEVGFVSASHGFGIRMFLFDGKYTGTVHSYEEATGFLKGVEAVLNHMVSPEDHRQSSQVLTLQYENRKLRDELQKRDWAMSSQPSVQVSGRRS